MILCDCGATVQVQRMVGIAQYVGIVGVVCWCSRTELGSELGPPKLIIIFSKIFFIYFVLHRLQYKKKIIKNFFFFLRKL